MPDPREVLTRPARPPDTTLSYGPGIAHAIDVRLPAGSGPAPLVVVVHGGFWKAAWDRAHAGPLSEALAAAGYVVATPEYRRVGMPGGGWPGTFDDIAALTDTVPGLVADATGRVDPTRTVLVGHSAGGHLAAWAAARHRLPPASSWRRDSPLPVAGVVSLAGVLDLAEAELLGLGDHAVRALLGGRGSGDGHLARIALASPAELLPTGVPTVLVHGGDDEAVPAGMSRAYARQARALGDPVELRELPGLGHFELIDPLSPAWSTVLAAVRHCAA